MTRATRDRIAPIRTAVLGLLLLFGLFSCQKPSPPAPISITPLQTLVNSDTSLTLFHRMILQANETILLADDSVTLLIPTNAAFRQAGYSEMIIDSLSATFADRMVRYQYLRRSRVIPDSGSYIPYPTLLGPSIYGTRDNSRHILFNGVAASGEGTLVGKAFVYRMNGPVQSAADSLSYLIQGDSTLSFLAEALYRTNLYDSVLLSGSYTLLAPVNTAWQQAGYDSVGAIDSADINVLIHVLGSQVLKGLWFTNSLSNQQVIPNLSGGSVTVGLPGPGQWQFSGTGNAVPANWLSGNAISGSTLVVHRIDAMISP